MALFTVAAHILQVVERSMSILSLLEMEIHRTDSDTPNLLWDRPDLKLHKSFEFYRFFPSQKGHSDISNFLVLTIIHN